MNRRDFLRRSALIAAGVVAADQIDLLDRLGWRRKFFPGWTAPRSTAGLYRITGIESTFHPEHMATLTFELRGEQGSGAVVLDRAHPAARSLVSRYHVGDMVRVEGDWGDWPTMGESFR